MKITVSGTEKEVKDGLTLPELIEMENVETPEYVTVSINEEFVESAAKDGLRSSHEKRFDVCAFGGF